MTIDIKSVDFCGVSIPTLGQGTWKMAERPADRRQEIAALRHGIDLGLTLIDTAEMYAEGEAETLVGEVIAGQRDRVFLVSKAYPQNASKKRLPASCEASLNRLGTDRLDLYLLHWRGSIPLAETVEAMERLVERGKIRQWGVSNFDIDDMNDLLAAGGANCATNQILYNLSRRGPEFKLMPWLAEHAIPVMAYSPVEQGRLLCNAGLRSMADALGATPAQVALAWALSRGSVLAIPKAGTVSHVEENQRATELSLTPQDHARLDQLFPKPTHPSALKML